MPRAAVASTIEAGFQLLGPLRRSSTPSAIALSVGNWRPGQSPYALSDVLGIALYNPHAHGCDSVFLDIDSWNVHEPAKAAGGQWKAGLLAGLNLITHNDSFLRAALSKAGIAVEGDIADVHKLAWLLHPERRAGYSLASLGRTWGGPGHRHEDILHHFGCPQQACAGWDGSAPWPGRPFPPSLHEEDSGQGVGADTGQAWEIGLQAGEAAEGTQGQVQEEQRTPSSAPLSLPLISLLHRSPATCAAWRGYMVSTARAAWWVHEGLQGEARGRPWKAVYIRHPPSPPPATLSTAFHTLLSPASRALCAMEARGIGVNAAKAQAAWQAVQREIDKEEGKAPASPSFSGHEAWEMEWSGLSSGTGGGGGSSRTRIERLKGIQADFLAPCLALSAPVIHPSYHMTTPTGLPVLSRPRVLDGWQGWESDMAGVCAWEVLHPREGCTWLQVHFTDLPLDCALAYTRGGPSKSATWSVRVQEGWLTPAPPSAASPLVHAVARAMSGGRVQYEAEPWLARVQSMCWDVPCGRPTSSFSRAWGTAHEVTQAAVHAWWHAAGQVARGRAGGGGVDLRQRVQEEMVAQGSNCVPSLLGRPTPVSPSSLPAPAQAILTSMADVLSTALARMQSDAALAALHAHPCLLRARHGTIVLEVPEGNRAEAAEQARRICEGIL